MALDARHGEMRPGEREGRQIMIECCRCPPGHRVTLRAIVVEVVRDVIRICHTGKVTCVARVARRGSACITRGMALDARHCEMGSGKREGRRIMIECRRCPPGRRVTLRAIVVEVVRDMIGICHSGEVTCVARVARRRSACIATGVALNTGHGLVCTRQCESRRRMIEC